MENPKLSCIIPIYNASRHLKTCLDHILAAGLEQIEIILIDDGSTDGSGDIARTYMEKHPFIRVERQKNAGPSAARNRGLSLSRGEYIAFFDADDYIDPDAFRKMMTLVRQYPEAELWVSDFRRVSDNGCVLDQVYQIDEAEGPIRGREYLRQFLNKRGCVWNVWRYVFKREFLICNGLRFAEGADCAEDLEFIVRALTKAENPAFFHEPYYFYRVNYGETLTRRYDVRRVQHLTAMLQCSVRYLKEQRSDTAQIFLNKIISEFFLNLALLWEVPSEERAQVRGLLRETAWIAKSSDRYGLKLLGIMASGRSINALSWLIYRLKCVKRRIRKARIAYWTALRRGVVAE